MVSALEITDLIALTMVFATVLSAYATCRTEQVTNQISLISKRLYIGLESIKLVGNTNPKVVEDLRNFSTVQAEQTRVSIVLRVDVDALSGDSEHQQHEAALVFPRSTASFLSSYHRRYLQRGAGQGVSGDRDPGALQGIARRRTLLPYSR
jgi:hypothetical protein